ncbi:MAG TPA: hypothetical protein PLO29_06070, partial [Paludibacter sp.]|nr:hypothetical protein [Paludibacter sp.]
MDFKIGDRVKHKKMTQWGLGQIVKFDGPYCVIFFVSKKDKNGYADFTKDYLDLLEKVEGKEADHPLLNNLRLPDKGKDIQYKSISELVLRFLKI